MNFFRSLSFAHCNKTVLQARKGDVDLDSLPLPEPQTAVSTSDKSDVIVYVYALQCQGLTAIIVCFQKFPLIVGRARLNFAKVAEKRGIRQTSCYIYLLFWS